jgi:ribosomal protein L7/L12
MNTYEFYFIIWIGLTTLILVYMNYRSGKQIEQKISRLERNLNLILQHLDIENPQFLPQDRKPIPFETTQKTETPQSLEDIKRIALDPARKIEALKLYRTATGAGLREAKEAIENYVKRHSY